ncbi:MAG TPA: hypothetical protein VLC30_01250 [Pseudomonas sp.]|nr:hypothetical protein [Pseudomonas sp.]
MHPAARTLLLALALSACATSAAAEYVQIKLKATQRNAGNIGQATLVPRGELTDVSATISGVPIGMTYPVRLYVYIYPGSCSQLGAQPAYALNRTVQTYRQGSADVWQLSRSAAVPLTRLLATPHALVLRTPPADGNQDIFCGAIR